LNVVRRRVRQWRRRTGARDGIGDQVKVVRGRRRMQSLVRAREEKQDTEGLTTTGETRQQDLEGAKIKCKEGVQYRLR